MRSTRVTVGAYGSGQRCRQPARRLERDHGIRPLREPTRELTKLAGAAWQVSDELKAIGGEAADDEGGLHG